MELDLLGLPRLLLPAVSRQDSELKCWPFPITPESLAVISRGEYGFPRKETSGNEQLRGSLGVLAYKCHTCYQEAGDKGLPCWREAAEGRLYLGAGGLTAGWGSVAAPAQV